jgi:hypothetical protein
MVVGFIIRGLKGDPLLTDMFGIFFQKKLKNHLCVIELTPTKQLIAAPLCRWVDHHLHYSPHIKLPWFILIQLIDLLLLLLLLLFEYK